VGETGRDAAGNLACASFPGLSTAILFWHCRHYFFLVVFFLAAAFFLAAFFFGVVFLAAAISMEAGSLLLPELLSAMLVSLFLVLAVVDLGDANSRH
jgi:hypothetical protein